MCLTITYYQMSGANWLHGIEFNFPPGWDMSSVTDIQTPQACGSANGNWMWMESVTSSANGSIHGPGFFYDANSGGPQDGNPGNNYGDNCSNFPSDFTFCFTVTLDAQCGGGGSPLDGANILPVIHLLGDGESGSWGGSTACESTPTSPNLGVLTLNCCDAESGVPPAEPLNICGTTPFDLMDTLQGPIDTPGLWAGPAGWSGNGSTGSAIFDPNVDGPGVYSYSVVGTDDCINTSYIVIENIDLGPQATTGYCDSQPVPILNLWTNPNYEPPPSTTWTDPAGTPLTGGILDPAIHTSGLFLGEYYDAGGCYTTVQFNIVISPGSSDPLVPAYVDICTLDDPFCLMDSLAAVNAPLAPIPGGQWVCYTNTGEFQYLYSNSAICIDPDNFNGAGGTLQSGYCIYYSINPPCPLTTDTVFINVEPPFEPGEHTLTTICNDGPMLDFDDFLGMMDGTPNPNGTWYTLDGAITEVSFPFDPAAYPPNETYTFMYEGGLVGTQCLSSNVLELTILSDETDAGSPGTAIVCETELSFSMYDSLQGTPQPNGEWVGPAPLNDVIPGGFYIPAIHSPGVYTYTITSPCGSDQTTLTVTELTVPDPGISGTLEICTNDMNVPLISGLGGTPDGPGTWYLNGNPVSATVNGDAVNDGDIYTYEVGPGGCQATSQVEINLTQAPNAGSSLPGPHEYCETDGTVNLFTLLNPPPNVVNPTYWMGPSGPVGPNLNLSTAQSGTYTYTIPDNGCGTSSVSVDIVINDLPNAGSNGILDICSGDMNVPLSNGLGGTPDGSGTWFLGGNPVGPTVNGDAVNNGAMYTYVVGPAGCQSTAQVQINLIASPNAGTFLPGPHVFCESDSPVDLFTLFDTPPNQISAANWSGPGGFTGGTLNPATAQSGTYTYTIPNNGCGASSASVNITINQLPNAGTSGVLDICSNDVNVPLANGLGGTPDGPGTWQLNGSDVDATVNGDAVNNGDIYTYVVGPAGCQSTAQVQINLINAPNAGTFLPGPHELCESGGTLNLFSLFDTPPSSTNPSFWSGPNGFTGNLLNPSTAVSGTYTYTIPDNGCGSASQSVTISIESVPFVGNSSTVMLCPNMTGTISLDSILSYPTPPDAGTWTSVPTGGPTDGTFTYGVDPVGSYTYTATSTPNGLCVATATLNIGYTSLPNPGEDTVITVCESDAPFQLVTGGSPDSGGNWSPGSGMFIPGTTPPGTFTYEFPGGSCPNPSAQVTVIVDDAVNAGTNTTANVCESAGIISLSSYLMGSPDSGGEWNNLTSGDNNISDQFNVSGLAGQTINFQYEVSNGTCSESANLSIQVHAQPNAGPDVSVTLCGTGGSYNLNNIVDPGAESGQFQNPSNGIITLNASNSGTYVYEVSDAHCASDFANYNVTILEPLSVTNVITECNAAQTDYTVTFEITGGDGSYAVSGLSGTLNTSVTPAVFTSDLLPSGSTYSYTVSDGSPCPDVSVNNQLGPICDCPATASWGTGNTSICEGGSVDLVLNLSGAEPFYLNYTEGTTPITDAGPFFNGDVITVSPTQTTTYTLTQVSDVNCFTGVNASVTVSVESLPNAGPDVAADFCQGGTLNLNTLIDAGADGSGTFTGPVTVTNNTVPQTPASSGLYTYTVSGSECPDDQATYDITIYAPLSVSSEVVLCNTSQTAYTVSFEITGGDGNYTVPNGTITGSNPAIFTSYEIPNGTDYNFTVSDGSPCSDVVVQGVEPQCDCPAAVNITGGSSICLGECADLVFDLEGDGPFTVVYQNSNNPSSPITLTNINDQHVVTVCPTTTTTYTVLSVSDSNCDGFDTGTPTTVTVDQPLVVSNVVRSCDANNENYTLTFEVSGGSPGSYVVTSNISSIGNGSIVGGVFTSPVIPSGSAYNYTVSDNGACEPVSVVGAHTCECTTDAGSIQVAYLEACADETISVAHNGNQVLDGNDAFQFLLHDGSETSIGTVLATSATGTFGYTSGLEYGTMYYVTAVAGNNNGLGGVDLDHICSDFSNGVPVVFHEIPTANITGGATVCVGVPVSLEIQFTGEPPYTFTYSIDGNDQGAVTTSSDSYTLTSALPGTYVLTSISDSHCEGNVSGQAQISNFATPTADLGGNSQVCEGTGDGPVVSLTGSGPWTFEYSIDGELQEPVTTSSSSYVISTYEGGYFELVSVSDNNCDGSVSGAMQVEIIEAPTATLTGGGVVCEGNEAAFTVQVTGTGPWTVQYNVDGVPQPPLNINASTPYHTFESELEGNYTLVTVTDQNCSGQTMTSQASLVVNPIPSVDILSTQDEVCIGEQLDLTFDLQGNPPFDLTYVLDGDTFALSGIGTNYLRTIFPVEPVYVEVISISDGSNPTCANLTGSSRFIPVGELPDAPVLEDKIMCEDDGTIRIGVNPVPGLTYSWYPSDRLSDDNVANPTFHATGFFPDVRNFQYVLTASNGSCTAKDTMIISVDPGPRVRFVHSPDPVRTEDTKVRFENLSWSSSGQLLYLWNFDDMGTSQERNPVYEFPEGVVADYTVSLTAFDPASGCLNEFSDVIEVRPEMLVYVPNAFTPNSDGLNDLWGPVLKHVDESDYRLSIYNRLGELVFTTRDPNKKWNGSLMGGDHYVEGGVYIWVIEMKNAINDEEVDFTGRVTVVR